MLEPDAPLVGAVMAARLVCEVKQIIQPVNLASFRECFPEAIAQGAVCGVDAAFKVEDVRLSAHPPVCKINVR